MILLRISWRSFQSRPLRTVLTLLSIVIGVAAVVAVQIAIENSRFTQRAMLQSVAGKASLEIHSDGNAPFEAAIIDEIRKVKNVQVATPIIRRFSIMFAENAKRVRVQVLGVDPKADDAIREYRIKSGSTFSDNNQTLIDAGFAQSFKLNVGSSIKLLTNSGVKTAQVVGLVEPQSGSAVLQGGLILLPFSTAQKWYRAEKRCDIIQVIAGDGQNGAASQEMTERVQRDIETVLPQNLQVEPPVLRSELGREATLTAEQGLRLASAFSLMLAIFIIYNTFQMSVGERRKQLGILRALGTTRAQVIRLIVGEGIVLGVVGTMFGWLIGTLTSRMLSQASGEILDLEIQQQPFQWLPYALSGLCGMVIAFAGALFPARRASRLSPSEAMRTISAGELEPSPIVLSFLGGATSLTGLAILTACINQWIHVDHAILGCVLFLLGGIIALPTFIEQMTNWVIAIFGTAFGIEGRLAQRQLLKHRGRSSLTIGILFIALSTGLGMSCTILDNIRDVQSWYKNAMLGDFFLRSAMPSLATGASADMPDNLVEEVKTIEGIESVESLRFVNSRSGDFATVVVARQYTVRGKKFFDLREGEQSDVFDRIRNGDVVIGSVLAERSKLGKEDTIDIDTNEGQKKFKICGVANDYTAAGLTVYMSREIAEKALGVVGTDAIIVDAKPNAKQDVEKRLREITERESLLFQSQTDVVDIIESKVDKVVGGLWAVLALCSVVAGFGLVNTLTMNILEQTYEIGMLRTVAMTSGQVRKMVLCQALMMGFVAMLPAIFAGTLIAYLLTIANGPTTGHSLSFTFRPGLTALAFVGEMALVIAASLIPAQRAASMKITETVRFQ